MHWVIVNTCMQYNVLFLLKKKKLVLENLKLVLSIRKEKRTKEMSLNNI